ncbi:MAG: hypothetical protein ACJ8F7_12350 [Gemmataceae bacterium]
MSDEFPDTVDQAVRQVRADAPPATALERSLDRANQLERTMLLRRRFRRRVSTLAAAAVLLAAGVAGWVLLKPFDSWAQHVQELRQKPWIHGVAKGPDGAVGREFWFAPSQSVSAMKAGDYCAYFDERLKITERYDPATKELVRGPQTDHDRAESSSFAAVLRGIGKDAKQLDSPMPLWDVTDQRQRTVDENGQRWQEYELTLVLKAEGPPANTRLRWTFRVNPRNRLPEEIRIEPLDGQGKPQQALTYKLDYPAEGPKDIYALGVPKDVKIVDTVPTGDLARLVAGVKAGRDRLDNYRAVCFEYPVYGTEAERTRRESQWWRVLQVSQITRKGDKIRIELGILQYDKVVAPAEGENLVQWWRRQSYLAQFQTIFLCDGKEVYKPLEGPGGALLPQLKSVQKVMPGQGLEMALRSSGRQHPIEHYAYPDLMVPSELFDTQVIEKPADGPPGTVQIDAKARREMAGNAFNVMKYWIDPKRSHVVVRSALEMHANGQPVNRDSWVDHRMEQFERSPNGVWYPTFVRWVNSVGVGKERGDQCRRYILEFPPEISDDVFKAK